MRCFYNGGNLNVKNLQICARFIFDSSLRRISFDDKGVLNNCRMVVPLGNQ